MHNALIRIDTGIDSPKGYSHKKKTLMQGFCNLHDMIYYDTRAQSEQFIFRETKKYALFKKRAF